jgi:hypothetical protein
MEPEDLSRFNGLRLIKEAGTLFMNDYYSSFTPTIVDLIKTSKKPEYYKDPIKNLALQLGLLELLQDFEEVSSKGKKLAREKSDKEIAMQSKRNNYISKAIKEIADGVAWRTLQHSRFKVRLLSQGMYSGHTWGKIGQSSEIEVAQRVASQGSFVLVHDITNCLRVGDLSLIKPGAEVDIYLAEIKANKIITPKSILKKTPSNTSKQEKRLIQAQVALSKKVFPAAHGEVPVIPIKFNTDNHMNSVGAVLKKAEEKGAYGKMVSPYLHIEAIDLPKLFKMANYKDVIESLSRPKDKQSFSHSSYDRLVRNSVGEVERNSPPYTIYPLPVPIISKLIKGEMLLTATLYIDRLADAFKSMGWELSVNQEVLENMEPTDDKDIVEYFSNELLFPSSDGEEVGDILWLKNPRTGFNLAIGEWATHIVTEYISARYIVNLAEAMMKIAERGKVGYFFPEIDEHRRWL